MYSKQKTSGHNETGNPAVIQKVTVGFLVVEEKLVAVIFSCRRIGELIKILTFKKLPVSFYAIWIRPV